MYYKPKETPASLRINGYMDRANHLWGTTPSLRPYQKSNPLPKKLNFATFFPPPLPMQS